MRMVKFVIFLVLICYNCFSQTSYYLDTTLLGKPKWQDCSNCLGWSLIYGLLSYDQNIKNNSKIYFDPIYNYKKFEKEEGISFIDLRKSIVNIGLNPLPLNNENINCYEDNPNHNPHKIYDQNDFDYDVPNITLDYLKEKVKKGGFVLLYQNYDIKNSIVNINPNIKLQLFKKNGNDPPYNHAIFCIGFDNNLSLNNNKGAFKFRDTDFKNNGMHRGEIWISYNDFKKGNNFWIKYLISLNSDNNLVGIISYNFENFQTGEVSKSEFWLGKPLFTFKNKKVKYYFNQHDGFKISVLSLNYIGTKAKIAVLSEEKEIIYAKKIKEGQAFQFAVGNSNYILKYARKTFWRGKMNWYPEINYKIENVSDNILYK